MLGIILTILKFIAPFIPNAQQRQQAQQAIQDNYNRFLQTTDSPLYAAVRSIEILGALWDVFFNHGRAWALASASLASTPFGVVELVVLLWPFFGNTLSTFAMQAMQIGLKQAADGTLTVPAVPVKSVPVPRPLPAAPAPDATPYDHPDPPGHDR